VLWLVETGADAPSRNSDLMEICRPEGLGEVADLGSTLAEAKRLLTSIQRAVVASQADHHGQLRPECRSCSARCHVKDWRPHRVATLFGEVMVRLPDSCVLPANAPKRASIGPCIAGQHLSCTSYRPIFRP
jgi:hypothetical protein